MSDPIHAMPLADAKRILFEYGYPLEEHFQAAHVALAELNRLEQAVANEQHDVGTLCQHLTTIYEWASGGVVSKPMTLPEEVIAIAEERLNREREADIAEATKEVEEHNRILRELVAPLIRAFDAARRISDTLTEFDGDWSTVDSEVWDHLWKCVDDPDLRERVAKAKEAMK